MVLLTTPLMQNPQKLVGLSGAEVFPTGTTRASEISQKEQEAAFQKTQQENALQKILQDKSSNPLQPQSPPNPFSVPQSQSSQPFSISDLKTSKDINTSNAGSPTPHVVHGVPLTQDEFTAFLGNTSASNPDATGNPAMITGNVLEAQRRQKLSDTRTLLRQGNAISPEQQNMLNQEFSNQSDFTAPLNKVSGVKPISPMTQQDLAKQVLSSASTSDKPLLGKEVNLGISQALSNPIGSALEIFHNFESFAFGRKGGAVTSAESAVGDMTDRLTQQIDLVKMGQNPAKARLMFDELYSKISDLEATQHGIGRLDARYQVTKGKDIQVEVQKALDNLEYMKLQLQLAENTAAKNRAVFG